jgi:anti-sigma factor RsiW
MDCQETRALVPLSLDRELDAKSELALAAHLDSCAACCNYRHQQESFRSAIRGSASYHDAPPDLRGRIAAALPQADRGHGKTPGRMAPGRWRFGWQILNGAGLAAAACAALVLAVVMPLRLSVDEQLADEVIAGHARALLTQHVTDVASSDQHTVKPWFNGKLDFSPPVRDFAEQGFPLAGGRLDYLNHQVVAVLVYRRHQHVIDVFIWPGTGKAFPLRSSRGYHVTGKTASGMNFLAISDVAPGELQQFVDML